jgi:hypothetical protein
LTVPTPSPASLGDATRNGYAVAGLLALVGIGTSLVQRLRRI